MRIIKRLLVFFLTLILVFLGTSCGNAPQKFTATFIEYFDTVATVTGYEKNEADFNDNAAFIEEQLSEFHKLYDIYNSYENINNIYTINANAGIAPVNVDKRIIDLLDFSEDIFGITEQTVDITMGKVLKIWHDCRVEGTKLPEIELLKDAAKNKGFDNLVIDRENETVYIKNSGVSLDLGAVAKGYATEQIAKALEEKGISGYALNIGGNIRVVGNKPDDEYWTAAITDPNNQSSTVFKVNLERKSLVTSGSYIRYYVVDSVKYHHIINPKTLFPSNEYSSVSVICDDSGLADCLSTALFNLEFPDGLALVRRLEGVEAVWIKPDGEILYSDGFNEYIIKE